MQPVVTEKDDFEKRDKSKLLATLMECYDCEDSDTGKKNEIFSN